MKCVVLAAGYATRLGELTKNFPKPLLKIGNNTILGRMLDDIDQINDITEHIIVTNHKFAPIFEEWVKEQGQRESVKGKEALDLGPQTLDCNRRWKKPITIIDDGSTTNDNRLGAVCDLLLALSTPPKQGELEGVLVVAADNLLFFSFQEFVDFAKAKGTSCIMCHEQPSIEKLQENGCGKDAPGNLAHYMVEHTTMHAWPMSAGRFDIGSLDTYYEAVEKYGK